MRTKFYLLNSKLPWCRFWKNETKSWLRSRIFHKVWDGWSEDPKSRQKILTGCPAPCWRMYGSMQLPRMWKAYKQLPCHPSDALVPVYFRTLTFAVFQLCSAVPQDVHMAPALLSYRCTRVSLSQPGLSWPSFYNCTRSLSAPSPLPWPQFSPGLLSSSDVLEMSGPREQQQSILFCLQYFKHNSQ